MTTRSWNTFFFKWGEGELEQEYCHKDVNQGNILTVAVYLNRWDFALGETEKAIVTMEGLQYWKRNKKHKHTISKQVEKRHSLRKTSTIGIPAVLSTAVGVRHKKLATIRNTML